MRTWRLAPVLGLAALGASAQVVLQSGAAGFSGASSQKNVVRAASGALYALSVTDSGTSRPLLLQTSADGGTSWATVPVTLNDATSGLNAPNATNYCAMAIDSIGLLHVIWGSYYYPTFFNQYYRNYDTTNGNASAIVNLTTLVGANPAVARSDAMAIVVDAGNFVWIASQGTSAWISFLLQSDQPSAQGLTFSNRGAISPVASSQQPQMAVDIAGRIHCIYYANYGPGVYEHRYFTPGTGWGPATVLGNLTPTNDYLGTIAADLLGNVHVLYVMDAFGGSNWLFRYKRWDATNLWGPEVVLFDATPMQYGTSSYHVLALQCDEPTGTAYAIFRDYSTGGALRLARKALNEAAFTHLPDVTVPSAGTHAWFSPALRGSIHPPSNQTTGALDLTFRSGTAAPYSFVFLRIPTDARLALRAVWTPSIGTTAGVVLQSSSDGGRGYGCGFSLGSTPGIVLSDSRVIPLNVDILLLLSLTPGNGVFGNTLGNLDAAGYGLVTVLIPNDMNLIGITVWSAFIVIDPGSPLGIRAISPALPFTVRA